jgi:indolepyruvate ferredoxin oxidoreductase alpha subunit
MHSSQNEQDSRFYAKFAMIPAIEPSNQQEAYDAAKYAFSLSEQIGFPVMIRLVTLLAHSRSNIKRSSPDNPNPLHLPANISSFILLPSNARNQYQLLIEKQAKLAAISEQSPYNIQLGSGDELGIIAFGIAFNYAMEVKTRLNTDVDILKISQYPIPIKKYNNSSKLINKYS